MALDTEGSDQEEVSLHGGRVPGRQLQQSPLPQELCGRLQDLLLADHLKDVQSLLQTFLQKQPVKTNTCSSKVRVQPIYYRGPYGIQPGITPFRAHAHKR